MIYLIPTVGLLKVRALLSLRSVSQLFVGWPAPW